MIGYLRTLLLFYRRHLRVQPLRELMAVAGSPQASRCCSPSRSRTAASRALSKKSHTASPAERPSNSPREHPKASMQRISEEVQRMPAVKASAPIFEQPIVAVGPKGRRALTLVGATEQIAALGGKLSLQFQQAGEVPLQGLLVLTEPAAHAIGAKPGSVLPSWSESAPNISRWTRPCRAARSAPSPKAPSPPLRCRSCRSLAGLPDRVTRVLIQPQPRTGSGAAPRAHRVASVATLNARPVETEAKLLGERRWSRKAGRRCCSARSASSRASFSPTTRCCWQATSADASSST